MASLEDEPKDKVSLTGFLTDVLRATYLSPCADTAFLRMRVRHTSSPGAARVVEDTAEKWGIPLEETDLIKTDFQGFVAGLQREYQDKLAQCRAGRTAFRQFMRKHGNVVDYIAALAQDKEEGLKTPEENVVFSTLQRLGNNLVMGELGVGNEEMATGIFLTYSVDLASKRHAVRIGQDPDQYSQRVSN